MFRPITLIQASSRSSDSSQSGMMAVFEGMLHENVLIRIDDILLFAKTF